MGGVSEIHPGIVGVIQVSGVSKHGSYSFAFLPVHENNCTRFLLQAVYHQNIVLHKAFLTRFGKLKSFTVILGVHGKIGALRFAL